MDAIETAMRFIIESFGTELNMLKEQNDKLRAENHTLRVELAAANATLCVYRNTLHGRRSS